MKVEHITAVSNNSVVRNTNSILVSTRNALKDFKIAYQDGTIDFPDTPFSKGWRIKITASSEGAVFDIMKGEILCFMNVCCFGPESEILYTVANDTLKRLPFGATGDIRKPVKNKFLITVPIMPLMSPNELQTAGEVEFYIYNELYIAWLELQN